MKEQLASIGFETFLPYIEIYELMKAVLGKNFEVYIFNDAVQLFLHLSYSDADMILMDHMVGTEVSTEILRKLHFLQNKVGLKKMPVILHSGHEQINQIAKSLSAEGVVGFIQKPCSISYLRNFILMHLQDSDLKYPVTACVQFP